MATISERIGAKIKKLRKQRKLSQESLAELSRVDPKSIVEIESGKRRNPTLRTITRLARALGVRPSDLL